VARLARAVGFVAPPRPDRQHDTPTPFLGGLALILALLGGLLAGGHLAPPGARGLELESAPPVLLLFFLSGAAFLLGLVDDGRRLSPPAKMAGQVVLCAAFMAAGFAGPFRSPVLDGLFGYFWIVGLMNAANFLDNMDGILAVAAMPGAAALALLSPGPVAAFSAALAGSLLGFLAWNRPKAHLFMGDAGSLLVGMGLASAAWMAAAPPDLPERAALWAALPLLVAYPIFDMTFVTVTRLRRRQSPWIGGRDHTTHRLATLTGSGRRALFVVAAASTGAAALGVLAAATGGVVVPLLALAGALLLFLALGLRLSRVAVS
jgi:UDP-GlcNAc:undecaprenyl-phosphate GlcNAc-1-phosphate transferase